MLSLAAVRTEGGKVTSSGGNVRAPTQRAVERAQRDPVAIQWLLAIVVVVFIVLLARTEQFQRAPRDSRPDDFTRSPDQLEVFGPTRANSCSRSLS
jgi:hypothetical protein